MYRILKLADKYDTPIVGDLVRAQACLQAKDDPPRVFGLGVVNQDLRLAWAALKHFSRRSTSDRYDDYYDGYSDEENECKSFSSVGNWQRSQSLLKLDHCYTVVDVPVDLLKQFPATAIVSINNLTVKSLVYKEEWSALASQFKVTASPPL